MDRECEERRQKIIAGFRECRNAFTAIGDETRQLILLVLLESDLSGIRVGEIAEKAHLTRPSVSHHLQLLKASGIVAVRREGTKNYYYIDFKSTTVKPVIEFWQQAEPMLMLCNKVSKECMKQ